MYLTHPLMVIDPCAKYGMPMSKLTEVTGWTWRHDKSYELDTKTCQKPYKFDLEVKVQSRIWIMNVHHTHISWWYTHVPNMVSQCQTKTRGPWATPEEDIYMFSISFYKLAIISPCRRAWLFIWKKNLNFIYSRMLYAKFGWNWPNSSEVENF